MKLEQMTCAREWDNGQKSLEQYLLSQRTYFKFKYRFHKKNKSKTTSRLLCTCIGMNDLFVETSGKTNIGHILSYKCCVAISKLWGNDNPTTKVHPNSKQVGTWAQFFKLIKQLKSTCKKTVPSLAIRHYIVTSQVLKQNPMDHVQLYFKWRISDVTEFYLIYVGPTETWMHGTK